MRTEQANEAIVSGIPESELFTPVLKTTGERLIMRVKGLDQIQWGRGYHGIVKDELTGKQYKVYGKACGLNCYCDAYAVEVV